MHCKAALKFSAAIKTALLLCALFCLAAAQAGKEKVAFYFSGNEPKAGIYKPLSGFITMAIVNSGTYIAIDRTQYVLDLIAKEQTYQRTGAVDDAKISELGKQWEVKYVIAIEASKSIDGFYLEAKMVDVEKAYVAKMGAATSRLADDNDLKAATSQIIELLGIGGGSGAGTASKGAATPQPTFRSSYFTDSRDGQKYRIVKIGIQTWMAENLKYKMERSWCYNNDESNCLTYGRLYDGNAAKIACPKGWHLPSRDEWNILMATGGGVRKEMAGEGGKTYPYDEFTGKKLKSTSGWDDWKGGTGNGTDEFGFSAMPGGYREGGKFFNAGWDGRWWSATAYGPNAHYRFIYNYYGGVFESYGAPHNLGFSVRCVQDN
ncbi:MAG: fibrobacter succinogenes major paralogous domain-containing protein [Chitinispirillales bacterium]|jgi:uncharacterized protein (TIGR02145 family)|nr:fibrobacter succinogenes major paralogous domain-containing protein [Chitinispirillales bacterium]